MLAQRAQQSREKLLGTVLPLKVKQLVVRTLYEELCDFNQGLGKISSDPSNADKQDKQ